jgi:hypothetical protein
MPPLGLASVDSRRRAGFQHPSNCDLRRSVFSRGTSSKVFGPGFLPFVLRFPLAPHSSYLGRRAFFVCPPCQYRRRWTYTNLLVVRLEATRIAAALSFLLKGFLMLTIGPIISHALSRIATWRGSRSNGIGAHPWIVFLYARTPVLYSLLDLGTGSSERHRFLGNFHHPLDVVRPADSFLGDFDHHGAVARPVDRQNAFHAIASASRIKPLDQ